MKFVAYQISPIDSGWQFLPTIREFAIKVAEDEISFAAGRREEPVFTMADLKRDLERAKKLAVKLGWDEGDYSGGGGEPRVMLIPGSNNSLVYGFVWKQDDNGETYVISPQPLDYLQVDAFATTSE